jgi:hypothetical protein
VDRNSRGGGIPEGIPTANHMSPQKDHSCCASFHQILSIPIPGLSDNYNTKGLRSEVESRERNDHRAANYYDSEESCPRELKAI